MTATKSRYLDMIWKEGAFLVRQEPFTLKSGRKSHVYANHRNLICDPTMLGELGRILADLAVASYGAKILLCAVESSTSPYLTASASLQSQIPLLNYRPINREKGLTTSVFSQQGLSSQVDQPPRPVVLVDDVVTTSRTIDTASQDLEYSGWAVLGAVCLLDRQAPDDAASAEVHITSVATLSEVIDHGIADNLMPNEMRVLAERERV